MITCTLDYGTRELGIDQSTMLAIVLFGASAGLLANPGFGALSDVLGRRRVYMAGAVLMALWAFPMFWLLDTATPALMILGFVVGNSVLAMMYGPQAALFAEMFSARVRYSGASMGYQIALVFAGGLAPIIMVSLLDATETSASISGYIIVMAAITLLSVYLVTETFSRTRWPRTRPARARPRRQRAGIPWTR